MPTFLEDTFTDTDGVLIQNHTPDLGGTWEPLDWQGPGINTTENAEIRGNRCASVNNGANMATRVYRNAEVPSGNEYVIEADVVIGSAADNASWQIWARLSPTGTAQSVINGYAVRYRGDAAAASRRWELVKLVSDITTVLDTFVIDATGTTPRVKFIVNDALKEVYIDGVLRLSSADNVVTQVGRMGFNVARHATDVNAMDNLLAYVGEPTQPGIQVCACEEAFVLQGDDLCIQPGLQDLRQILSFTTPGVYTFDKASYPWLSRIRVRVQGAGGGSGGTEPTDPDAISAGSGGGGGGFAESVIEASSLSDVEQVVVGEGGAAGAGFSQGGRGGLSAFGSHALAEGGAGGRPGSQAGGNTIGGVADGGAPLAGQVLGYGGDGEPAMGRGILQVRKGGSGGATFYGGGRAGRGSTGDGQAGRISSGEGGSGATSPESWMAQDGAAGADGRVVVYLFG